MLTPDDKNKLATAFRAAMDDFPFADKKIKGISNKDGQEITHRELLEKMLASGQIYQSVEEELSKKTATLDQIIHKFKQQTKIR